MVGKDANAISAATFEFEKAGHRIDPAPRVCFFGDIEQGDQADGMVADVALVYVPEAESIPAMNNAHTFVPFDVASALKPSKNQRVRKLYATLFLRLFLPNALFRCMLSIMVSRKRSSIPCRR